MDLERGIETQRLKLLRLVAGLVVLLGLLSVGPVSRVFSVSVCAFVGSILSRAEAAAKYLVIAQARLIVARRGMNWDRSRFSDPRARIFVADQIDVSLADCRARLKALRAVLMNLPRHALRLVRRIEQQIRGAAAPNWPLRSAVRRRSVSLCDWRLATRRIERPPDKTLPGSLII